jgi:hypothetical protein
MSTILTIGLTIGLSAVVEAGGQNRPSGLLPCWQGGQAHFFKILLLTSSPIRCNLYLSFSHFRFFPFCLEYASLPIATTNFPIFLPLQAKLGILTNSNLPEELVVHSLSGCIIAPICAMAQVETHPVRMFRTMAQQSGAVKDSTSRFPKIAPHRLIGAPRPLPGIRSGVGCLGVIKHIVRWGTVRALTLIYR